MRISGEQASKGAVANRAYYVALPNSSAFRSIRYDGWLSSELHSACRAWLSASFMLSLVCFSGRNGEGLAGTLSIALRY